MNSLIEWWARNTVAANLLMFGIFVAGVIGFTSMEREMNPQVRFPGLEIEVIWPGAAPQEVEEQIVARIEESVSDMDAIEWVRSSSAEGYGGVYILAEQQVDFTQFMNDVKIRVDSIPSLPRDIEPPKVRQWVNRNEFIRVAVHGDLTEQELKRLAEKLRREAAVLPAITVVQLFGVRREEVSIQVSEEALRRYSMSFNEVATAIRNTSINQSSGSVRTEVGTYQLKVRSQADTEAEFADIIIRQTDDGGIIRVGDVATVVDGFEDNPILATLNGEPAVLLQVMTTETMDIVRASDSIREWIDKRQDTLPEGARLTLWTDNAEDFKGRMATIGGSAGIGLLLVLIFLVLTLRPIVAFWVAVGIATAYAGRWRRIRHRGSPVGGQAGRFRRADHHHGLHAVVVPEWLDQRIHPAHYVGGDPGAGVFTCGIAFYPSGSPVENAAPATRQDGAFRERRQGDLRQHHPFRPQVLPENCAVRRRSQVSDRQYFHHPVGCGHGNVQHRVDQKILHAGNGIR
jgi:multidrug efflux pump subunit AcrB